uniref:non-specific serine/threonine protein kinase n=1 Tax=Strongyloides papillosus TaxID=174720 RepID=A0A0N5BKB0_STREA
MPAIPHLKKNRTLNCDFCQFRVLRLLGQGGFGAVYLVEEVNTKGKYAVKTELIPGKHDKFQPRLLWEETILLEIQALQDENQKKHFIKIVDRGTFPPLRYMLMTLVGKSLYDLQVQQKNRRFSDNTCWRIAEQTLEALEAFHNAGFVHRDIKPQNYTIGGEGREDIIYLLDFGLVRCYTGKQFTHGLIDRPNFAGTIKYCSRSAHLSVFQYPKDDFESWVISIMNFHNQGSIFWSRETDLIEIKHMKMDLFAGKEPYRIFRKLVPSDYKSLVRMVGDLTPPHLIKKPNDIMRGKVPFTPFYEKLKEIQKNCRFSNDKPFDWQKKKISKTI